MATGGYDFTLTSEKLKENFKCIICQMVLREPVNINCVHTFCRVCLKKWRETKNKPFRCPNCNQIYDETQITVNAALEHMLRTSFDIYCKKQEDGCGWIGTIDDYDLHANRDCEYAEVLCPNNRCEIQFVRRNQKNHLSICPMRIKPCPYCAKEMTFQNLEVHYGECDMIEISCLNDGCNKRFKRKDHGKHQNECGFQIVNCVYEDIGCTKKLKRNETDEHEKNINEHFYLMYQQYRDMKQMLFKNIEQLNETRRILNETKNELNETKNELNETKHELNETNKIVCQNIAELNDMKEKLDDATLSPNKRLDELTLSPNERIEHLMDKLKYFQENVINYEILFKELFDTMEKDKAYLIKNRIYIKCRLDVRWQKETLFVSVVDERKKFDGLKTDDRTVHHNKNVCVCVYGYYVDIFLLVDEKGWMWNNTRFIIHPKLHKKEEVGGLGYGVIKNDYREYLFDGCLLVQICRK